MPTRAQKLSFLKMKVGHATAVSSSSEALNCPQGKAPALLRSPWVAWELRPVWSPTSCLTTLLTHTETSRTHPHSFLSCLSAISCLPSYSFSMPYRIPSWDTPLLLRLPNQNSNFTTAVTSSRKPSLTSPCDEIEGCDEIKGWFWSWVYFLL